VGSLDHRADVCLQVNSVGVSSNLLKDGERLENGVDRVRDGSLKNFVTSSKFKHGRYTEYVNA
jgi:hypothetical protein